MLKDRLDIKFFFLKKIFLYQIIYIKNNFKKKTLFLKIFPIFPQWPKNLPLGGAGFLPIFLPLLVTQGNSFFVKGLSI